MTKPDFVTSNGLEIPFNSTYFAEMRSSAGASPSQMTAHYTSDGYLYLPQFLNREGVLDIRERYFSLFQPSMFQPGTTPRDGIFSGVFEYKPNEHGHENHPAYAFVANESFLNFTANPLLAQLASLLLNAPVTQLPRKPLRQFYKDTHISSKAHADFTYLDKGTSNLLSVWIPLGDVPLQGGGLIYLRHSHTREQEEFRAALKDDTTLTNDKRPITANLQRISEVAGEPWLYTNFAAGDILVHSPFIVHATLDCATDAMRLSTDLRFAAATDPLDPRWANRWRGNDGY